MVVLHENELVALKARKVGGMSLEIALSKYATKSSIITPIVSEDERKRENYGFRGPQNYLVPFVDVAKSPEAVVKTLKNRKRPRRFYNHISAKDVRCHLGESLWSRYTKIAIIRNPFDYAVSSYYWGIRGIAEPPDFENWCLNHSGIFRKNDRQYKIDGNDVIDFYIRFENLKEDIVVLEEMKPGLKGLWETFSTINAKGGYRPKKASTAEVFENAPKAFAMINDVCAEEIERFGFDVP